jgi:hypothetical protein
MFDHSLQKEVNGSKRKHRAGAIGRNDAFAQSSWAMVGKLPGQPPGLNNIITTNTKYKIFT